MNWYTVILLYPEGYADFYGESYTDYVLAPSATEAASRIKRRLARQLGPKGEVESPEEFIKELFTFGVIKGRIAFEEIEQS